MMATKIFIIAWQFLALINQGSEGNEAVCQQQADSAFQFLRLGESDRKESCHDMCCQHPDCHVSIHSGSKCYGIRCARGEVCNLISEQLSSFEGHRVDKRSTDDDDDDDWAGESDGDLMKHESTYKNAGDSDDLKRLDTSERTGNDDDEDIDDDTEQQNCNTPHFHHSYIPRRRNSFQFSNLHNGKISLLRCSERCCKMSDCVLAFLIAKSCFGVICSGDGNCHTQRDHLPRKAIFVSTVSKVINKLTHRRPEKRTYNSFRETGPGHHYHHRLVHSDDDEEDSNDESDNGAEKKNDDIDDEDGDRQKDVASENEDEEMKSKKDVMTESEGETNFAEIEDDMHEVKKKSEIEHGETENNTDDINSDQEENKGEKRESVKKEDDKEMGEDIGIHHGGQEYEHVDIHHGDQEYDHAHDLESRIVRERADDYRKIEAADPHDSHDSGEDSDDDLRQPRHDDEDDSGSSAKDIANSRSKRQEHEHHHSKEAKELHGKKHEKHEKVTHQQQHKKTAVHHKKKKKSHKKSGKKHHIHKKKKHKQAPKKKKSHTKKKKKKKKKKKPKTKNKTKKKHKEHKKHVKHHKHVAVKHNILLGDEGSGEDRDESNSYDDSEFSSGQDDSLQQFGEANKRDDIPHTAEAIEIEHERPTGEMLEFGSPLHDKNSQLNDEKMDILSWDNSVTKESVAGSKPSVQDGEDSLHNVTLYSQLEDDHDSGDTEFELPQQHDPAFMLHNQIIEQDQGSGVLGLIEDEDKIIPDLKASGKKAGKVNKHDGTKKRRPSAKAKKSTKTKKHHKTSNREKSLDDKIKFLDSMTQDVVEKKQKLESNDLLDMVSDLKESNGESKASSTSHVKHVQKKQKSDTNRLLNIVADLKKVSGGSKASSRLKRKKKGSKVKKDDIPVVDKNLSQEDSLLNKMMKELEHLNKKGEKKSKSHELLQKDKTHAENPLFLSHVNKHEITFLTTKKSSDQMTPMAKKKTLPASKKNYNIQQVVISTPDEFADLDLESGSGSGAPFIIDTPKKVKKIVPIEKVKPTKATPKPKPKSKSKQEKEKDNIPSPEDILKIHNKAKMELTQKQAAIQTGNIFNVFGGKLKSLSNTNSLIEGDKALEAIDKFEMSGEGQEESSSVPEQLNTSGEEKPEKRHATMDIMSISVNDQHPSDKHAKKKSKSHKKTKTSKTKSKKSNHQKKSKKDKLSVIGSAITTRKPSASALSTGKPRFRIISGTLTPSVKPTITVPMSTVSVDSISSTEAATVTVPHTVPTVAVDESPDAKPTKIPGKNGEHKENKTVTAEDNQPTIEVTEHIEPGVNMRIHSANDAVLTPLSVENTKSKGRKEKTKEPPPGVNMRIHSLKKEKKKEEEKKRGKGKEKEKEKAMEKEKEKEKEKKKDKEKGKKKEKGKEEEKSSKGGKHGSGHKIPTLNIQVGDEDLVPPKPEKSHHDKKKEKELASHEVTTSTNSPTTTATTTTAASTSSKKEAITVPAGPVIINNRPTPFKGTIKVHLSTPGTPRSTDKPGVNHIITTPEYKVPKVNDPYIIQPNGPTAAVPAIIHEVTKMLPQVIQSPMAPLINPDLWKKLLSYMGQGGHGLKDLKNAFFTPTASPNMINAHLKPTLTHQDSKKQTRKVPPQSGGFTYAPITGTGHVGSMPDGVGVKKIASHHDSHKDTEIVPVKPLNVLQLPANHVLPKLQTHDLGHHSTLQAALHQPPLKKPGNLVAPKPTRPPTRHVKTVKPDPMLIHNLVLGKPEPVMVNHLKHTPTSLVLRPLKPTTSMNHFLGSSKPGLKQQQQQKLQQGHLHQQQHFQQQQHPQQRPQQQKYPQQEHAPQRPPQQHLQQQHQHPGQVPGRHTTPQTHPNHMVNPTLQHPARTPRPPGRMVHMPTHRLAHVALVHPSVIKRLPTPKHRTTRHVSAHFHNAPHRTTHHPTPRKHPDHRHTTRRHTTRRHPTHKLTTRHHTTKRHHTTRHHTPKKMFNQFANHHYPTPTHKHLLLHQKQPTTLIQRLQHLKGFATPHHLTRRHTTGHHVPRHHTTRHHTTRRRTTKHRTTFKQRTPPRVKLVKNAFASSVNHLNHPTVLNHPNVLLMHPNVLKRPTQRLRTPTRPPRTSRRHPTQPVIRMGHNRQVNIEIHDESLDDHEIRPLAQKKGSVQEGKSMKKAGDNLDSFFAKHGTVNADKHDVIEHGKRMDKMKEEKEDEQKLKREDKPDADEEKRNNNDQKLDSFFDQSHGRKKKDAASHPKNEKEKENANEILQQEKEKKREKEEKQKEKEKLEKVKEKLEKEKEEERVKEKDIEKEKERLKEREKSREELANIKGCDVVKDLWGKEFASNPGYLYKLPNTVNSTTCARKCCHHDTCHVAYYKNKVCNLVQCSNRSACANLRSSHDNTRLVYLAKSAPQGTQHYCQKNFALGVPWDKTKAGESALRDCPRNAYGKAKRYCDIYSKWESPDFTKCVSQEYSDLKEKSRGLGYTTSAKELLEELDDVTTQTIDNSLIFGGDIMKASDTIGSISNFLQKTKAEELSHKDLKSFTRSVSNLLDETNQQEWTNLKPRSFGPGKLMSSMENIGLYAAERLPRSVPMKPVVTHTIVLQVARLHEPDPLGDAYVFPNYSTAAVSQWSPRKDTITLPFSIFNTNGDTLIAASNYKSLGYVLPHRWNTKKAVTFTDGFVVNSNVLSCSIKPKPKHAVKPPVTITLHHIKEMNQAESKCVYWDFSAGGTGSWSTDGCWLYKTNRSTTICKCNHLTHFAVLSNAYDQKVSAKEQSKEKAMAMVWLGIPLSIILLVGALYACFSWSKDPRRRHVVLIDKKPHLPEEEPSSVVETPVVSQKFEPSPKRYLYASNTKSHPTSLNPRLQHHNTHKWGPGPGSPSKSSSKSSNHSDLPERNGFTTPSDLEWELTWDYLANTKYSEDKDDMYDGDSLASSAQADNEPSERARNVEAAKWNYQDETQWSAERVKCPRSLRIEATDTSETQTEEEVYHINDNGVPFPPDAPLSEVFRPVGISSPQGEDFARVVKNMHHGKNYLRISFDADIDSSQVSSRQSYSLQGSEKGGSSDRESLLGGSDHDVDDMPLKTLDEEHHARSVAFQDVYCDALKSICVDVVLRFSAAQSRRVRKPTSYLHLPNDHYPTVDLEFNATKDAVTEDNNVDMTDVFDDSIEVTEDSEMTVDLTNDKAMFCVDNTIIDVDGVPVVASDDSTPADLYDDICDKECDDVYDDVVVDILSSTSKKPEIEHRSDHITVQPRVDTGTSNDGNALTSIPLERCRQPDQSVLDDSLESDILILGDEKELPAAPPVTPVEPPASRSLLCSSEGSELDSTFEWHSRAISNIQKYIVNNAMSSSLKDLPSPTKDLDRIPFTKHGDGKKKCGRSSISSSTLSVNSIASRASSTSSSNSVNENKPPLTPLTLNTRRDYGVDEVSDDSGYELKSSPTDSLEDVDTRSPSSLHGSSSTDSFLSEIPNTFNHRSSIADLRVREGSIESRIHRIHRFEGSRTPHTLSSSFSNEHHLNSSNLTGSLNQIPSDSLNRFRGSLDRMYSSSLDQISSSLERTHGSFDLLSSSGERITTTTDPNSRSSLDESSATNDLEERADRVLEHRERLTKNYECESDTLNEVFRSPEDDVSHHPCHMFRTQLSHSSTASSTNDDSDKKSDISTDTTKNNSTTTKKSPKSEVKDTTTWSCRSKRRQKDSKQSNNVIPHNAKTARHMKSYIALRLQCRVNGTHTHPEHVDAHVPKRLNKFNANNSNNHNNNNNNNVNNNNNNNNKAKQLNKSTTKPPHPGLTLHHELHARHHPVLNNSSGSGHTYDEHSSSDTQEGILDNSETTLQRLDTAAATTETLVRCFSSLTMHEGTNLHLLSDSKCTSTPEEPMRSGVKKKLRFDDIWEMNENMRQLKRFALGSRRLAPQSCCGAKRSLKFAGHGCCGDADYSSSSENIPYSSNVCCRVGFKSKDQFVGRQWNKARAWRHLPVDGNGHLDDDTCGTYVDKSDNPVERAFAGQLRRWECEELTSIP